MASAAPRTATVPGRSPVATAIVNGTIAPHAVTGETNAHRPERQRLVERREPHSTPEPGEDPESPNDRWSIPSSATPTATSSATNPAACEITVTGTVGTDRETRPPEKSAMPQAVAEASASRTAAALDVSSMAGSDDSFHESVCFRARAGRSRLSRIV